MRIRKTEEYQDQIIRILETQKKESGIKFVKKEDMPVKTVTFKLQTPVIYVVHIAIR